MQRIHLATDSLEEKIQAIDILQSQLQADKDTMLQLQQELMAALAVETAPLLNTA